MTVTSQISIITGANRGFGRTIVEVLSRSASEKGVGATYNFIITVSRDASSMDKVLKDLDEIKGNSIIKTITGVELSNLNDLPFTTAKIDGIIKSFVSEPGFKNSINKRLILFNNAGSLCDVSKKATELELLEVHEYMAVNFSSFSFFCSKFKNWQSYTDFDNTVIVNTSSHAAVKAFAYYSLYCSVKVSRDMYMKVLALEEPTIKTLNYSPGPMDNDMQKEVREKLADLETKTYFQQLFDEKKLVRMEDSVAKLLHIIDNDAYESGEHIDYYDYKNTRPLVSKSGN